MLFVGYLYCEIPSGEISSGIQICIPSYCLMNWTLQSYGRQLQIPHLFIPIFLVHDSDPVLPVRMRRECRLDCLLFDCNVSVVSLVRIIMITWSPLVVVLLLPCLYGPVQGGGSNVGMGMMVLLASSYRVGVS